MVFRQINWSQALGWVDSLLLFEASVFAVLSKSFDSNVGIVVESGWKRQSSLGLRARWYSHLGIVYEHLCEQSLLVGQHQVFAARDSLHSCWIV